METVTETFWFDLNGRIACNKHIGSEASYRLANKPSRNIITTSLTQWLKMTEKEATEMSELAGLDHTICETCRRGK
jgi:hypothetical protein